MPRKNTLAALFLCVGLVMAARPAAAEVKLTMSAGRVSLSAKNAPIGQILTEWAKVGQTKIVNAERVGGGPMTLELTNVPEVEALEIVLRAACRRVLAPARARPRRAPRGCRQPRRRSRGRSRLRNRARPRFNHQRRPTTTPINRQNGRW